MKGGTINRTCVLRRQGCPGPAHQGQVSKVPVDGSGAELCKLGHVCLTGQAVAEDPLAFVHPQTNHLRSQGAAKRKGV